MALPTLRVAWLPLAVPLAARQERKSLAWPLRSCAIVIILADDVYSQFELLMPTRRAMLESNPSADTGDGATGGRVIPALPSAFPVASSGMR